jgi:hypothetical protein
MWLGKVEFSVFAINLNDVQIIQERRGGGIVLILHSKPQAYMSLELTLHKI